MIPSSDGTRHSGRAPTARTSFVVRETRMAMVARREAARARRAQSSGGRGVGFGVSASALGDGYGEGPDETIESREQATVRVLVLLKMRGQTVSAQGVVLRELRGLVGVTQEELAGSSAFSRRLCRGWNGVTKSRWVRFDASWGHWGRIWRSTFERRRATVFGLLARFWQDATDRGAGHADAQPLSRSTALLKSRFRHLHIRTRKCSAPVGTRSYNSHPQRGQPTTADRLAPLSSIDGVILFRSWSQRRYQGVV